MSRLFNLACLLMAALAVGAQVFGGHSQAPRVALGRVQRPILQAERTFSAGDWEGALEALRLAALRAAREGWPDVQLRVRHRLASMGMEAWKEDPQEGWQFIATACLLSPDFAEAARRAEGWVLSRAAWAGFHYPIMRRDGSRSLWGTRGVVSPSGLYRACLPEGVPLNRVPGGLYNHTVGELPPGARYAWVLRTLVSQPSTDPVQSSLVVIPDLESDDKWLFSTGNIIQWDRPLLVSAVPPRRLIATLPATHLLDRVIGFGARPPIHFQVAIVRTYEPLPSGERTP